jgi:hypothetical protein
MKKFIWTIAFAVISVTAFAQISQVPLNNYLPGFRTIDGTKLNKMVAVVNNLTGYGTAVPVLSSCGTTPAIAGSNTAGEVTMGTTATGCVITFATAFVSAPYCMVTWQATPLASQSYTISSTAITTVQTSASNNKLDYYCLARQGG